MIREAGVTLDRALFPLLSTIDRRGPIGVVDLADLVGRDHTTVSRQVAVLQRRKLISRQRSPEDGRSQKAVITDKGKQIIASLDAARERLAETVLARWTRRDLQDLVRLMRRLADDLNAWQS